MNECINLAKTEFSYRI